jgi:hypothetical protein
MRWFKYVILIERLMLLLFFMYSSLTIYAKGENSIRVVKPEELASRNGIPNIDDGDNTTNDEIWLAIMSEVYDVSSGTKFYKEGAGYHIFAGRDANVPFITGIFTEEEAAKSIRTCTLSQKDVSFAIRNYSVVFSGLFLGKSILREIADPINIQIKDLAPHECFVTICFVCIMKSLHQKIFSIRSEFTFFRQLA